MSPRTSTLIATLFLPAVLPAPARAEVPGDIEWLSDLGKARTLAASLARPLLIVFR
jgi:hypothetical protein